MDTHNIITVSVAICAILSACGAQDAPAAFDYETADKDARLEWLAPRAEAIADELDDGLNGELDDPMFTVDIPKMDPALRHVEVNATAAGNTPPIEHAEAAQAAMQETLCKSYVKTPYSGEGVETTVRILGPDGNVVMIVKQSEDICASVLATS